MSDDRHSTPGRWREVEEICARALDLSPELRTVFLDDVCAGDPDLRREAESLLVTESEVGRFLETSAGEIAADLLAQESTIDFASRRLGSYVIDEQIGSGGMGDVYRARDERLGRDVALKVLPGVFADQADRVAHFLAEARVLATLNHPNIAIIHGLEEADGVRALVLELVEGRTLADLIAGGALPIEEAVPVARQIAEALEAAHERGIIHRDLKPSNAVVRPDGTVKVLDFGLAKVLAGDPAISSPPGAPAREVMGTPAYMSPEQAKGLDADKRSDIWAFGAVLYEMLAGRPAFAGDSTSDTLRAVVSKDVDWSALPESTPASARRLIGRCLDRDVKQRLRDIGEARIALSPHAITDAEDDVADRGSRRRTRSTLSRAGTAVLGGLLVTAFGASAAWYLKPSATRAVTRFPIALPEGHAFSRGMGRHSVAISPDGAQIVYSGVPAGLYLRRMSEPGVKAIPGSTDYTRVTAPVFSPDGRSIAFHADGAIKTISVTGGTAVTLAPADAPYGITWGSAGLLFGQGGKGIIQLSPTGDAAKTLVRVEAGEEAHGPQLLPDRDHILFTLATGAARDRWDKARIVVQSVASGARTTILEGGSDARYLETGHIVYAQSATIYAVPFDVRVRRVTGTAVALVEGVSRATGGGTGAAHFSVSETGTLVYIGGSALASSGLRETMQLGLIDRRENVQRLTLPAAVYQVPRVSPDGTRIAFTKDDGSEAVVWIYDLSGTAAERRLTFGGNNRFPVWSADSMRVAFQSDRDGDRAIFWQLANGSGPAERLTMPLPGTGHVPESWSPRGDRLLFSVEKDSGKELWVLARHERTGEPFGGVRSSMPIGAVFSPDGKWVAYSSDDQGRQTIYVQPFPATGAKYQFPAKDRDTPCHPVWSPDGTEIFYNPRPQGLEVVSVTTAPTFAFGRSVAVPRPFWLSPPELPRGYDITPDDRFLARVSLDEHQPGGARPEEMHIVLNWFEELRARLPRSR